MRLRYSQLIGMKVIGADGARIGRIHDLLAEPRGESLCVATLLVGERALMQRISFRMRRRLRALQPHSIPWTQVDRIEGRVMRLCVTRAEYLAHSPAHSSPPATHADGHADGGRRGAR